MCQNFKQYYFVVIIFSISGHIETNENVSQILIDDNVVDMKRNISINGNSFVPIYLNNNITLKSKINYNRPNDTKEVPSLPDKYMLTKNMTNPIPKLTKSTLKISKSTLKMSKSVANADDELNMTAEHYISSIAQETNKTVQQAVPLVGGVTTQSSGTSPSTSSSHYNVLELVKNLDIRLKDIRNVELGVTIVQEIFDAMDFQTFIKNDTEITNWITKRMIKKLKKSINIVNELNNFIINNITSIIIPLKKYINLNTIIQPCPFDDFTLEQNYNKQQIEILNYLKNTEKYNYDNNNDNDYNFTLNAKILNEIQKIYNREKLNNINNNNNYYKHIFYLSSNDHASDHNCQYYFNDMNFRQLYVSSIKNKHIFLLIDHGNSLNIEQLELSKNFAANVINILSDTDTISIVTVAGQANIMKISAEDDLNKNTKDADTNENNVMYYATLDNKELILKYIEKLNRSNELTNHARGFQLSFELLYKQNISSRPIQFLYISRGLLSRLTESMTVLSTIANGQRKLRYPVIINTCAIILDEKRVMYEKQFLRDIANQNYTKYDINVTNWLNGLNIQGKMFIVTKRHPERIIKTSCAVFEEMFLNSNISNHLEFHQPVLDYNTKDMIISITRSIKNYGVIGVNMYLSDLAEDIIYYKKYDTSYAFMIDINGFVIHHPAFSRPIASTNINPHPVDIGYLERERIYFDRTRTRILTENIGNATTYTNENLTVTYTWQHVLNAYIVCVITTIKINGKFPVQLSKITSGLRHFHQNSEYSTLPELLYHRIDLIPPQTPVCRHFRQIATLDSGTVFLSASSFQSPFVYMKNNHDTKDETRIHNAQSIMAYIKDVTNLLANPGLNSQIRHDVSALFHVMSYLKKRHQEGGILKKYIIRRYAATINGVILVYPGCILGADLEPTRRPWFRKAMKHSGKIIITEPYLDAGGAGYIVTIAHTIFEGKANALHNAERDLPVAIVAIDIPYGFLYKVILDSASFCSETNIKCILMEDEGYLIAHPSFLEPSTRTLNNRRPQEHITHKESFVANDILNHKRLVRKRSCANYQNRTIERYYTFNTSLTDVLTNVVHGERTKYQITSIKGTNLFAIVLNTTCDGGAFCPCSTVDKVCLNCNRMDQSDCECPCECPLHIQTHYGNTNLDMSKSNANSSIPINYCEPPVESLYVVNSLSFDWDTNIKQCMNINCDLYVTQNDCLGVMGCEWCQLDIDGNAFTVPFCTQQNSCFNGVLGSVTPYGDGDIGSNIIETSIPPAYSAIGPVGGAIIALCLVVGFAMYCYRQNLDNGQEQLYGDSMHDDNYGLPLSRFNFDDVSPHDDSDLSGGANSGANIMHRNLLNPMGNAIAVPDISPYHMSSGGYRRPNGESDHGYSTMTPHEDSEHMCFTLVEPLINNKRLSMSDSISINTSVSSPTNNQQQAHTHHHHQLIPIDKPTSNTGSNKHAFNDNNNTKNNLLIESSQYPTGQTVLTSEQLSPHHILAAVTVHRHMEAS